MIIKDVIQDVDVDRSWVVSSILDGAVHSSRRHVVIDKKWYPTVPIRHFFGRWLPWNLLSPLLWQHVSGVILLVSLLAFVEGIANTPWQITHLTVSNQAYADAMPFCLF
jgi:hypothetical protein